MCGPFQVLENNLTGYVTSRGDIGIQVWHVGMKAGSTDLGREDLTVQTVQQ